MFFDIRDLAKNVAKQIQEDIDRDILRSIIAFTRDRVRKEKRQKLFIKLSKKKVLTQREEKYLNRLFTEFI